MTITLTRIDGGLHIAPAPPYITKYLKYSHRSMEVVNYKRVPTFSERLLHTTDNNGGIYTLQGYFEFICQLIQRNKDIFTIIDDRTKLPDIDWNAVKAIGLRDYQIKPIIEFLNQGNHNSGIIKCVGGWGKTIGGQAVTYAAWNSLNTILAIPLKQVFEQTLTTFKRLFPNKHVGAVGNGIYDISKDITITTFKSLNKCALEKCQLLLVDEIQSTTGDKTQECITPIRPIRSFGFTATDENLFNGADKVIKGLFGERLVEILYDEGLEKGAVIPGLVYFVKTPDCMVSAGTFEAALSQGIKNCKPRNQLIGKICTKIPKGWQVIAFVDHVKDHLVKLHSFMPEGTRYVHRDSSKTSAGIFALTNKQQKENIEDFINNKYQFMIATDCARAGFDVQNCRVVIQASGGASEVELLQEAYRGSRVLSKETKEKLEITDDKTHFVLIDFQDNHDERLKALALKREKIYRSQGWKIKYIDSVEQLDWYDFKEGTKAL